MRSPYGSTVTAEDWRAFQAQEQAAYRRDFGKRGDYFGHFSIDGLPAVDDLAVMLSQIKGPVLDVGCGVLPVPSYLKECRQPFGIDPYYGDGPRRFPFAQAVGEGLPFKDGCFSGVSIMSTLDHALNPFALLREVWRVLRDSGTLFVWYISREKTDWYHPWSFTTSKLIEVLAFGFCDFNTMAFNGDTRFPRTHGLIASKMT